MEQREIPQTAINRLMKLAEETEYFDDYDIVTEADKVDHTRRRIIDDIEWMLTDPTYLQKEEREEMEKDPNSIVRRAIFHTACLFGEDPAAWTDEEEEGAHVKMENKMTPQRILEIYEDLVNRYELYVAGEEVEFPYDELPGVIYVHLPPIYGKAGDKEKFKGQFEPDDVFEGTVVATMDSCEWGWPAHILDVAGDDGIRVLVAQMLFPDAGSAYEFLDSQEF
ncbi:MAG: hypothetical protein ACLQVJ_03390 [Syntrophobacteraceae bacterium]